MWSLHNHSHGRQLQMQSILFLLLLLVSMLTSFQFSQTFIHHRRSSYVSSAYHHILHPIYRRTSPTTNAASASSQFDVGDDVIVVDDDGATFVSGRIEQKRGGWYTVLSMRDSKRLKRRGSQLQPNNKSTGSESGSSQQPLSNFVDSAGRNSEGNDEPLPEMQENIVDLDSILQLMQHSPQSIHQNNQTMSRETLDQIASCHSQYNQWIIFSDLHVMPSTLTTCLQVLDTVHEIANRTNSGIIFLGDWWHHRGFVRVDCLNAVLNALAKWTVPCIMIPGNHDQTDWAGLEHALTPLSNAYRIYPQKYEAGSNFNSSKQQHPGPLILSNPTKFLNALFIPHIRDKMMMNCILSSIEASSSSALFVHADVKGASMNDLIQSQHGLPASIFPNDKQIYSGHFHKPHRTQSIRYVGSPYQTSFAESGQVKTLLVVDSNRNWQCIEEIPIDIGPRYHRVSSIHRFLDYDGDHVRKGDKVSVTVDQFELEKMRLLAGENATNTGKKSLFDDRLEEFRKSGVVVEIRDRQPQEDVKVNAEKSTIDDENVIELENLSPKATLAAYLDDEVASGSLGETASEKLFETGVELIRNTTGLDTINGDSSIAMCPLSDALVSQLEIEAVSVRGFGSFRQEVVYPLSNRGLVLLRGTNKDGLGSDSNGVGKSTLAMAALWALAGTVDPRPTQDGKVSDVVNDFCKVAEVSLRGSINSKPFSVTRIKSTSSQGSSLTFVLDGTVLTQQSILGTQQLIDHHFCIGSQILMRTIFHGQHTIGGLLESSDAKLKEELSHLVSLVIWQQSASLARSRQRELLRKASELEGMLSMRAKDKMRAEEKARAAKEEVQRREGVLEHERHSMMTQSWSSNSDDAGIENDMESVQTQLHECTNEINSLEDEISKIMHSNNDEMIALRAMVNDKSASEGSARANLQACQRKYDMSVMELQSAGTRLSNLKSEWDVSMSVEGNTSTSFATPETCRSCGQPILSSKAQEHVRESINEMLTTAISLETKAKHSVSVAELALSEAREAASIRAVEVQACMEQLRMIEEMRVLETDEIREKMKATRLIQSNLSAQFTSLARRAKEITEQNLLQSRMQANVDKLKEALNASVVVYEDCCSDLERIDSNLSELTREKDDLTNTASHFALLADKLGPKGVQAFVLRNIVHALQYCSQSYLNELSDGSLQLRMEVGSNDSILKQAAVRNLDGTWRVRPLSSLSGGQWRRCSLSLGLGFIDLASKRGRLRSSLLVLDEPLTHLDSAGRKSVGRLLRKILSPDSQLGKTGRGGFGLSTILVILQEIAAEEIEECFDQIDEVIKRGGESFVLIDANQADKV